MSQIWDIWGWHKTHLPHFDFWQPGPKNEDSNTRLKLRSVNPGHTACEWRGGMVGIIGSTHGLVNSMWKMIGLSLEKPVHMRALFHPGDLMYASGWISSSKDWTSKLQYLNAPRTWHFPRKWQGQSLGLPTFLDKPLGHVHTLPWPRVKRCHGYGPCPWVMTKRNLKLFKIVLSPSTV